MSQFTDSYALKLVDQITAPLRRIEAHASKLNETMEKLQGLAQSGAGLAKLAAMAGAAGVGFVGLGKVVSGVTGLLEGAARAAMGFGEAVIKATSFREKFLAMFGNTLGDAKGKQLYGRVLDISQITPGLAESMMEGVGRLSNVGFRGRGLSKVNAAAADVQALFGEEKAAMFTRGISDMFTKSKFEEQDFKQAVAGIIPASAAQAAILRLKGITGAADKVSATFEKLKKQGKISGKEGVAGVLAALDEHVNKGKGLGSFAEKRGVGSLEGLISNISEAPANLLRRMDLENLPGIQSVKNFLKRLLVFFDAATPQGKKLTAVIEKMTNVLFGGLDKIGEQDLARFFEAGLVVAQKFVELVQRAWGLLDQIMHGSWTGVLGAAGGLLVGLGKLVGEGIWQGFRVSLAGSSPVLAKMLGLGGEEGPQLSTHLPGRIVTGSGSIADPIGRTRAGFGEALGKVGGALSGAWSNAAGLGGKIVGGLGASLGSAGESFRKVGEGLHLVKAREAMAEVGKDLSSGMEEGAREEGETHSPSLVMARVGADMVDGMVAGAQRRIQEMRTGGSVDPLLDAILAELRGVALRQGAALR